MRAASERPFDEAPIVFFDLFARHVRAIDGKRGDRFDECVAQHVERVIVRTAIELREPVEHRREHFEFARERRAHDVFFRTISELIERPGDAGELPVQPIESALGLPIDEDAVDEIHEVVTGRPRDPPIFAEVLEAREDLFDDEILRMAERRRTIL